MSFYDNYAKLCAMKGVTPSGAADEMGISRGSVTRWKTDTNPSSFMVMKVAEYFRVDPNQLLGDMQLQTGIERVTLTSDDERELLTAWRRADTKTKEDIAFILRKCGFKMVMLEQALQRVNGNE